MNGFAAPGYEGRSLYFGDIHNHCGLSYGYGSIDEAFRNARLQLDFTSVTGHAFWPDMPRGEPRLDSVVEYHERGFRRFEQAWDGYLEATEANNDPGRFVTFPSFEWHSMEDGDYVLYYRQGGGTLFTAKRLEELRDKIRGLGLDAGSVLLIPHHIGYHRGYRGINWDTFEEELSPLVEILSMHGCAESDDGPLPYLHTMGPRVGANTMQGGLRRGKRFGVVASTDHHNAHPGSYGHGRLAVWANSLSRQAIWDSLRERRAYALTGDRIALGLTVAGAPMGSEAADTGVRRISISVRGGYALEAIDVVKNGTLWKRFDSWSSPGDRGASPKGPLRGKIVVEVGWGETNIRQDWEVEIGLEDARIVGSEPRFRGIDIVDPKASRPGAGEAGGNDSGDEAPHGSSFDSPDEQTLRFTTVTYGNPTPTTSSTQGFCVEVEGEPSSMLRLVANGVRRELRFAELLEESDSFYLGGFLSGAVHIHRLVPEAEYAAELEAADSVDAGGSGRGADYYYVRVGQKNGQWAWSSPVWLGADPRRGRSHA